MCVFQAGLLKPDTVEGTDVEIPEFHVSYKPQKISPKFQSTVRHLLHQKIRDSYMHAQFVSDVMKPLQIEQLMDQEVVNLSGGELQRVALCLCLGKVCIVLILLSYILLPFCSCFFFFFSYAVKPMMQISQKIDHLDIRLVVLFFAEIVFRTYTRWLRKLSAL